MKKYLLVPSAVASRFLASNTPRPPSSSTTTDLPIPPEALVTAFLGKSPHPPSEGELTPPFDEVISTQLDTPHETEPARIILEYFRKSPIIRWTEQGVLTSPVPGVKLIELLKYLIRPLYPVSQLRLTSFKRLHRIVPFPLHYIRSENALKDLTDRPVVVTSPRTPYTPPSSLKYGTTKKKKEKTHNLRTRKPPGGLTGTPTQPPWLSYAGKP